MSSTLDIGDTNWVIAQGLENESNQNKYIASFYWVT
jgi:hypothetical protein